MSEFLRPRAGVGARLRAGLPAGARVGPRAANLPLARTLAALAMVALAACSQLEPVAPSQPLTDPTQLYVRLTLDHAAVNLTADATLPAANTLQLTATPYNGTGAAIASAPAPTFTSLDTTVVTVTADGLLQGRHAGNQVKVVAELTIGALRHADTALVNVSDVTPPPVLDTFSIHVPSDSAVWYVGTGSVVQDLAAYIGLLPSQAPSPRTVDAHGNLIDGLAIEYVSLDSAVAIVDRWSGQATAIAAGHARVMARTIAYGVAKVDTMTYTVQPPFAMTLEITDQGVESNATIVAGGIVLWQSATAVPMDITFDDPTNVTAPPTPFCDFFTVFPPGPYCGAGNVSVFSADPVTGQSPDGGLPWRFRQFPVPGTYSYHSTTTGAKSQIVVLERLGLP